MVKRHVFIALILLLLLILAGCWDKKELNELAIVTGLAIDKDDEDYKVTAQVINPGEIAGQTLTTRVAVSTYEGTGRSIFEAIRQLTQTSPRKLYLAHLRLVVIDEELAEQGLEKSLDFLSRDHEVRTDFYFLVSQENNASSILKVLTPIDKLPTNKIYSSIESSERVWAPTKGVHLDDLISTINAKGNNPVLTGIYATGDIEFGGSLENVEKIPSPTVLSLDHLGAFRGEKLVGWLNKNESKGYSYITDNVQATVGVQPCKGGNVTLEIYQSKTDVKVMEANQKPKVIVTVSSDAAIGEIQCEDNILDDARLKELEKQFGEQTRDILNQSINKAKELKTDIFGFGDKIHQQNPKLWSRVKENWNEEGFVELDVEITSEYNIRRTGTIEESLQGKDEGG